MLVLRRPPRRNRWELLAVSGTIPVARLCRLEKKNEKGEWVRVGDHALLYPHRYAERLSEKGKIGRATVLDERLQPTGEVYEVEGADLL